MSEEYAEKMSRKTLPELLLYVRNRAEYREDAVLAALEELDRRGQPQPEAAAIRAELGPIVEQQQAQAQASAVPAVAAAASGGAAVVAEEEGPALYSPGTIVLFSMLFSFLAGGTLLVINMLKLKESRKALQVVLFIVGLMLASVWGWPWLVSVIGPRAQFIGVIINVVAVLSYLLYFWPRYVGARPYVSRQWLPAFLVCMVLMGIYLAAVYYQLQP